MWSFKFLLICAIVAATYAKRPQSRGLRNENGNDCGIELELEGVGDYWEPFTFTNEAMLDTDIDKTFKTFTIRAGVTDYNIDFGYSDADDYIKVDVSSDNTTVTIKPTDYFASLDESYSSSTENDVIKFKIEFTFYCGENETSFQFIQPINDTNNNKPMFNREVYEYRFGMPIKKGAILTQLLEMYAVDIDMSNTNVAFAIKENDNINITYRDYGNARKVHYAKLVTNRALESGTNEEYQVTVTDVGNPVKTGTATVKIIID